MQNELWQYLQMAEKPIVLYGMGYGADKIIKVLEHFSIPFKGVFASDGFVREKIFHGYKVSAYADLKEKFGQMIVLLCFGSERPEVIKNIRRIAAEQELYAPDVPVVGERLFDREYVLENKAAFEGIYSLLADDISRKTFENTAKFKLTGKIDYLLDCEVSPDEPYFSFLKLSNDESFLDLGAYNGDTVEEFVSRVGGYRRITAVEPDAKTFKKLVANVNGFENVRCENLCISCYCGKGAFEMRGGRNSGTASATKKTDFSTVDALLSGEEATFVKMDIEGEEKNAILGMRQTILAHKPKMLISCYHRTEDLLELPKAVFDIRDDYKLYMRHFPALPAWDTNYYFV